MTIFSTCNVTMVTNDLPHVLWWNVILSFNQSKLVFSLYLDVVLCNSCHFLAIINVHQIIRVALILHANYYTFLLHLLFLFMET